MYKDMIFITQAIRKGIETSCPEVSFWHIKCEPFDISALW
jgi:hypothetical protein